MAKTRSQTKKEKDIIHKIIANQIIENKNKLNIKNKNYLYEKCMHLNNKLPEAMEICEDTNI